MSAITAKACIHFPEGTFGTCTICRHGLRDLRREPDPVVGRAAWDRWVDGRRADQIEQGNLSDALERAANRDRAGGQLLAAPSGCGCGCRTVAGLQGCSCCPDVSMTPIAPNVYDTCVLHDEDCGLRPRLLATTN